MQIYNIDTPDGASYKVEAENDAQAQSAISSYLPSTSSSQENLPFLNKAASNIVPDAKQALAGYGATIKEGAYDMPLRALQTGVQMAGGVPYAQTPSGQKDTEFVKNTPEMAKQMVQPVVHPIDYAAEHPVQQAVNVLGLLSGLRGSIGAAEAPKATPLSEATGEISRIPDSIGKRIEARTTAQALDINPLAGRRLAEKMNVSPEDVALYFGKEAEKHLPKDFISPMASANTKFTAVLDAHKDFGKSIGKIVDATSEGTKSSFPEAQETIDALKAKAENYYKVDGGDTALLKTAERLEKLQKAGKLDFDRLSQVKTEIGSGFRDKNVPPGTEEIYDILNNKTIDAVDRVSVNDPKMATEFQRLKDGYTVTSRLLPAMSRTAAKEVFGASVGGGVMSKALPAAVGGMFGGPMGAMAGAGAKYLQEAIAPDLGKNLAYMAMKAKPNLAVNTSGVPIAALAGLAGNANKQQQNQPIQDLIQQLIQKYNQRRQM